MIPTRTTAVHMGLAQHRCPPMSLVHPRASGADPPKWLGADQRDHRLLLLLSTCLSLPLMHRPQISYGWPPAQYWCPLSLLWASFHTTFLDSRIEPNSNLSDSWWRCLQHASEGRAIDVSVDQA